MSSIDVRCPHGARCSSTTAPSESPRIFVETRGSAEARRERNFGTLISALNTSQEAGNLEQIHFDLDQDGKADSVTISTNAEGVTSYIFSDADQAEYGNILELYHNPTPADGSFEYYGPYGREAYMQNLADSMGVTLEEPGDNF